MEFREKKGKESLGINITSLVDILFILLIFVLVSTTFLEQPALKIELPKAKSAGLENVQEIVVSISKGGEIYFKNKPVNKKELEYSLQLEIKKDTQMPVVLRADKDVPYGLVIEVMDIMRGVGVKKLVALTSPHPCEQDRGSPVIDENNL